MTLLTRTILVAVLVLQVACGTLLYPERRNQKPTGRVDPGVVVMDAAWLLVFIVPGIVALAVDFASGAIYLPQGQKHFLESRSGGNWPVLALEPGTRLEIRAPQDPLNGIVWQFELRQANSEVVTSWTWEAGSGFEIEVPLSLVGHLPLLIG
jgi:hypothetical protein